MGTISSAWYRRLFDRRRPHKENKRHRPSTTKLAVEPLEQRTLLSVAEPIVGLGVNGDSLSDEYAFETRSYASNWVELLAEEKGVNVGPLGDWGEPRREAYEYNWARTGADSQTLLQTGQHTGLAQQVDAGLVSHAVLAIGQNDFSVLDVAYPGIYYGLWSRDRIADYTEGVVANVDTALETLTATDAKLVVSNVMDFGVAPLVRALYPNPDRRELVTEVIAEVNRRIGVLAQNYQVPLIDMLGLTKYVAGSNHAPIASQTIGGVVFTNSGGFDPHNGFVADQVHPHTVTQAVFANTYLEGFRLGYGTDVERFTEEEIVGLVGLPYSGDTFDIDYSAFVVLPGGRTMDDAIDLGAVDFRELNNLDPSAGDLWYTCRTTHQAFFTLDAALGGLPDSATLTLYDSAANVLATSAVVDGNQRIDYQTDAGATYYFSLSGTAGEVDLRVANLVSHAGTTLTVHGTAGGDGFEFDASASRRVTINGVGYDFDDSEVTSATFDGGGGTDTAEVWGTAQKETAVMRPTAATLSGNAFEVGITGVAQITLHGSGGEDVASLYDSAGWDTFTAKPTEATLSGPGFTSRVEGFPAVHAYAGAGGFDVAHLYDSAGDDTFVARPSLSKLYGEGFLLRAKFFDSVHGYAKRGGNDSARLYDSRGSDVFIAQPTWARIFGVGYLARAKFFETVTANATAGGFNVAHLYDSAGDDTFRADPNEGSLTGGGFSNRARGFDSVHAYAKAGGSDVAHFQGSGDDDTFIGRPTYSKLLGPGYFLRAKSFEKVYARASTGGNDRAYLYDSVFDDLLEAQDNWARLSSNNTEVDFFYEVIGFDYVRATATIGNDTKVVSPEVDFLALVGDWND